MISGEHDSLSILADVALVCADIAPQSIIRRFGSCRDTILSNQLGTDDLKVEEFKSPQKCTFISNESNPISHTLRTVIEIYPAEEPLNLSISRSHCLDAPSNLKESYVCLECDRSYSTSSNLARHRQTHRSPEDKKAARKCPFCAKVYVSTPAYTQHMRTHNQGCKCTTCGKSFSRPWLLQGHIRTHTGEKPFKCSFCGKSFADKSNLRAHVQTHSNIKPFACTRCGKSFALKSYLYKHEESSSCTKLHKNIRKAKISFQEEPTFMQSKCIAKKNISGNFLDKFFDSDLPKSLD